MYYEFPKYQSKGAGPLAGISSTMGRDRIGAVGIGFDSGKFVKHTLNLGTIAGGVDLLFLRENFQ